jgi:curved DNA-binding protein CbpA
MENYYALLQLPNFSDESAVKNAFKNLLKSYHPDKGGSTTDFLRIKKAYDILMNKESKLEFDNIVLLEEQTFDKAFLLEPDDYDIQLVNSKYTTELNMKDTDSSSTNSNIISFTCSQCFSNNEILSKYAYKGTFRNNRYNSIQNNDESLLECKGCSIKYKLNI